MQKSPPELNQYKRDFFAKLNFPWVAGRTILDVGCGDGGDAAIFSGWYGLRWFGTDIYEHPDIKKNNLKFKKGSILRMPFPNNRFDYVFTHDVLHHIDEPRQRQEKHLAALAELRRVCKIGGRIVVVEGNRFNPLFYPHMVILRGHNHFRQSYFMKLIRKVFREDRLSFHFFEAHLYPPPLVSLFRVYEWVMEHIMPKQLIAYNVAIVIKR